MDGSTVSTELTIPQGADLAVLFRQPQGMDAILARIEEQARAQVLDVTTKKGRDAIASLAHKIARSKTALDDAGKALNEDARRQINAVDAERRKVRDRLDALKDEVRAPLTKWEADEAARVDALKARLERLRTAHTMLPDGATSEQISALLARVEATAIDDSWAEFVVDAARFKDQAVATLRVLRDAATTREAEQAELARLRAEAEARAEEDRKRAEAEAAERARLQAEQEARERAERIEREKQEAARRAAEEAEARAKAEAERAAHEAAEREAALQRQIAEQAAREEQARRDAEIRHAREVAEAKAAAERAAQAERDRIAAEERAKVEAEAKRRADAAHRAKIVGDIADALRTMSGRATPEAIADALFDGRIPHVRVVA